MEKRRDLERAAEEIEQLFADLWQVFPFSGLRRGFRLPVDCFRTDNELVVVAELAGVDAAGVQVVVHGRSLLLTGRRERPPYIPLRRSQKAMATAEMTRPPMPRPQKAHAGPMWLISQLKFIPKNPVRTVSGRKIVATIVSRSCT